MSTEFRNADGEVVATRFWGGVVRGPVVQVVVPDFTPGPVFDEAENFFTWDEVVEGCTVVPWTRFHANAQAVHWAAAARRFRDFPSVAFGCTVEAQRCRDEARR